MRGALYTRPMSWFTSLQLVLPLLPLQALLQLFDPLLRVAVVVVVMGGLSGTAERERERERERKCVRSLTFIVYLRSRFL